MLNRLNMVQSFSLVLSKITCYRGCAHFEIAVSISSNAFPQNILAQRRSSIFITYIDLGLDGC